MAGVARRLLDLGVDINAQGCVAAPTLHLNALTNRAAFARCGYRDDGCTALLLACCHGFAEAAELLLERGADVHLLVPGLPPAVPNQRL